MIIENNANEENVDKWTPKQDEKLDKIEQPMVDIEETIKNWRGENQSKRITKKNKDSIEEF